MKKPLFCFFYFFIFSGIFAQEKELEIMAPFIIEGIWTGKLTQVSGGIAREYAYEITISIKDSLISGMGTIKTGTSYANFDIKGKLIGSKVDLEDIKISNENIPNRSAWCIKKMPLKFKFGNGAYLLEGPWSGISTLKPCTPGMIFLRKETLRA